MIMEINKKGFNWESHKLDWYMILMNQMPEMASMGLTMIWFPPSSDSVSYEGYLPKDLYNLNSRYGHESQLKECIRVAHKNKLKVIGDLVLNHRCASYQNKNGTWNQVSIISNQLLTLKSTNLIFNSLVVNSIGTLEPSLEMIQIMRGKGIMEQVVT